ncbi:MAG: hypothetical protein ACKO0V_06795 [bacterium]
MIHHPGNPDSVESHFSLTTPVMVTEWSWFRYGRAHFSGRAQRAAGQACFV